MPTLYPHQLNTFDAICITHYFCSAYNEVVRIFIDKFGEKAIFEETESFLEQVRHDQLSLFLVSAYKLQYGDQRYLDLIHHACERYPNLIYLLCGLNLDVDPFSVLNVLGTQAKLLTSKIDKISSHLVIASCYSFLRRYSEAGQHFRDASTLIQQFDDLESNSVESVRSIKALYNKHLADFHFKKEDYRSAKECFTKSLHLYQRVYGPNVIHIDITNSLRLVGKACFCLNEYDEAMKLAKNAIDMDTEINGKECISPTRASALLLMGSILSQKREYEKGEEMLKKSYTMFCSIYGKDTQHPRLLSHYTHLATHYFDKGELSKSLESWKEIFDAAQQAKFQDKDLLAEVSYSIGKCNLWLGEFDQAWDYFVRSLGYSREIGEFDEGANSIISEIKKYEESQNQLRRKREKGERQRHPSGRSKTTK